MSRSICIAANCLYGPRLGGHLWVYVNWALGARANGCEVVWLEPVSPQTPAAEIESLLRELRRNLEPFGLSDSIAFCPWVDEPLQPDVAAQARAVEDAWDTEGVINLVYDLPASVVWGFRRSALVNIDPGLVELWLEQRTLAVADHDLWFTTGGRVFPDEREWRLTSPCVSLDQWPLRDDAPVKPFTSISNWYANEWVEFEGEIHRNDKRAGFLPFIDLPAMTDHAIELALELGDDRGQKDMLESKGWAVEDARTVAATPQSYRDYIASSFAEFACAKPFYTKLGSGWISDRTLCYLASGRPAIVQNTGPNELIDGGEGVLRFRDLDGAVECLDSCVADYERHSKAARSLAEQHFDSTKVVGTVLSVLA